jgi:putative hydrolase of the HAD superfamily
MIRAVAFDAVGTVITPTPSAPEVYAQVARSFGFHDDPATIYQRFCQAYFHEESHDQDSGWTTSLEREVERWQNIVQATLPGTPSDCFVQLYQHYARPEAWRVPDDLPTLLELLQSAGLRLALASNYDPRLRHVVRGHAALHPLEACQIISSEVGWRKPHPAFFQQVAEQLQLRPEAILFVGDDRTNDYDGAIAAGFSAVILDPRGRYLELPGRVASLHELGEQFRAGRLMGA